MLMLCLAWAGRVQSWSSMQCVSLWLFCYFIPQVTLLAEQDTSPNKDGLETGDINVEFSQLKLDDEGQYQKSVQLTH